MVAFVSAKCGDILKADGVTPIDASDDGWLLATLTRATFDDQTNGDMTVIDLLKMTASAGFFCRNSKSGTP